MIVKFQTTEEFLDAVQVDAKRIVNEEIWFRIDAQESADSSALVHFFVTLTCLVETATVYLFDCHEHIGTECLSGRDKTDGAIEKLATEKLKAVTEFAKKAELTMRKGKLERI